MPELTLLRRYLSHNSHGRHKDGGHSALLGLLETMDEIYLALQEQERWIADSYDLAEDQCRNLLDQHVQAFLSCVLLDTADGLGEDYLVALMCDDEGGYQATQDALDRWKAAHDHKRAYEKRVAETRDALGDLDDHPS